MNRNKIAMFTKEHCKLIKWKFQKHLEIPFTKLLTKPIQPWGLIGLFLISMGQILFRRLYTELNNWSNVILLKVTIRDWFPQKLILSKLSHQLLKDRDFSLEVRILIHKYQSLISVQQNIPNLLLLSMTTDKFQ